MLKQNNVMNNLIALRDSCLNTTLQIRIPTISKKNAKPRADIEFSLIVKIRSENNERILTGKDNL